jgi:hypothetical protein
MTKNCSSGNPNNVEVGSAGVRASLALSLPALAMLVAGCTAQPQTVNTAALTFASTYSLTINHPLKPTLNRALPAVNRALKAVPPARTMKATYLGRAPYICTPSGFGQKSGCFLRG